MQHEKWEPDCYVEERGSMFISEGIPQATCMAMKFTGKAVQTLFKDPSLTDSLEHMCASTVYILQHWLQREVALLGPSVGRHSVHCLYPGKAQNMAARAMFQRNQTELLFPHVVLWLQIKVGNSLPLCPPAWAQRELEALDKYGHGATGWDLVELKVEEQDASRNPSYGRPSSCEWLQTAFLPQAQLGLLCLPSMTRKRFSCELASLMGVRVEY